MRHQLLLAGKLPFPLGPRDLEETPKIGDLLTAEIGDEERQIEVMAITHLPVVPSGIFAHDEVWLICRLR